MTTIDISKRVLNIRNQKGYSQQKISDILGISRSFLSEVESGLVIPGYIFFLSFYKYLDININWLLTGKGEQYIEIKTVVNDSSQSSGDRLKKIRKLLKLTQQKMAIKLNITQGFLSSVESNRFTMGAEFLYDLNQQLNVNINWLLAGDGPMFLINNKCESENTEESQSQTDAQKEINENFTPKQLEILKTIISAEVSKNNRHVTDEELKLLDELKTEAYLKPMLDMIRDLSTEERKIFFDIISEQKRQSALGLNRDNKEIEKKSA